MARRPPSKRPGTEGDRPPPGAGSEGPGAGDPRRAPRARGDGQAAGDPRRALGARSEAHVAEHLEAAGYVVVDRNWRCNVGEIDLIVRKDDLLVFVEVRSVQTDFLDSPTLTVDHGKQTRVGRAADAYLRQLDDVPPRIRFDVVGVTHGPDGIRLEHFENAFVPKSAF